jgi:hypothetical protein
MSFCTVNNKSNGTEPKAAKPQIIILCYNFTVPTERTRLKFGDRDIFGAFGTKRRKKNQVLYFVRFEVFTAVTMKNDVFWDVKPFGSCKNRRFGGT